MDKALTLGAVFKLPLRGPARGPPPLPPFVGATALPRDMWLRRQTGRWPARYIMTLNLLLVFPSSTVVHAHPKPQFTTHSPRPTPTTVYDHRTLPLVDPTPPSTHSRVPRPPIAGSFLHMHTTGASHMPAAAIAPAAIAHKYRDVGVQTDGDEDPSDPIPPRRGSFQNFREAGRIFAKKFGWRTKSKRAPVPPAEVQPPPLPHSLPAAPQRPSRAEGLDLNSEIREWGRRMINDSLYPPSLFGSPHPASPCAQNVVPFPRMEGGASIASSHVEAQPTTSKPPFSSRAVSWSHFSAATPPSSTSPSIYASSDITSQSSAPSSSAPSKPADWVQQVGVCHREPSYARSAQPGQWAVIQSNLIRVPPLKEGKWITGGVLGTGGFARVYRVFNVAVEKACALKVVRFGRGISGSACAGVINELKVLSMLASEENPPPFLLQPCLEDKLWAWRSSTGNLHIVTEVCDGGSLASYRYGLAYDSLLRASAEIILGLNWLHEHGIVHHDLKPHNILVNGGGHCVIADYGGARFLNSERKLMRGSGTSLVMTTAFAAPEILAPLEDGDVQEYDEAADYWSLGATIVATFMHEDYLPGSADLALMAFRLQKIQEEMQDKGAPEELHAFIMDLLCMDPTQRCRYPAITKQRVFQHLNWEDVESQGRPAIVPRDLVCDAHGWRFPTPGVHRSQDSTADFLEELRAHHLSLELDDSYDLDRHHAHMTRYLSGRIIPRF